MKVKDLIKALEAMPQDDHVLIADDDVLLCAVTECYQFNFDLHKGIIGLDPIQFNLGENILNAVILA